MACSHACMLTSSGISGPVSRYSLQALPTAFPFVPMIAGHYGRAPSGLQLLSCPGTTARHKLTLQQHLRSLRSASRTRWLVFQWFLPSNFCSSQSHQGPPRWPADPLHPSIAPACWVPSCRSQRLRARRGSGTSRSHRAVEIGTSGATRLQMSWIRPPEHMPWQQQSSRRLLCRAGLSIRPPHAAAAAVSNYHARCAFLLHTGLPAPH